MNLKRNHQKSRCARKPPPRDLPVTPDALSADPEAAQLRDNLSPPLRQDDTGVIRYHDRYFVPNTNDLRLLITRQVHDHPTAGHPGRRKTYLLAKRHYWWPGMKDFIHHFVDSCDTCQRTKSRRHLPFGHLKSLPVPPYPWTSISMDLIEHLPTSNGYNSILVIVDRLTKMAIFVPTTTSLTAEELARLYVHHVFSKHGVPTSIISDRGSEFTSEFWRSFTKLLDIDLHLSTAFHPETDGQTERVNQVLEQYLRLYSDYQQSNWSELLPLAEFAYNSAPHSSTTVSPFFANKGYHPRSTFEPIPDTPSTGKRPPAAQTAQGLAQLHTFLRQEVAKALEASAAQYNKSHLPTPVYRIGDKVWLSAKHIRTTRPTKKLDVRHLGPYRIAKQVSSHAYQLDLPPGMKIHNVFHVRLLSPYLPNQIPRRYQPPPPPIEVEGEEEWEIEAILDTKIDNRYKDPRRYLVKYLGYDETEWMSESDLEHAKELLSNFNSS